MKLDNITKQPAKDWVTTFYHEIDRTTTIILAYPHAGRVIRPEIRQTRLRRFPYALIYGLRHGSLIVLAVANLHRRPDYWVERIK